LRLSLANPAAIGEYSLTLAPPFPASGVAGLVVARRSWPCLLFDTFAAGASGETDPLDEEVLDRLDGER